MTARLSTAQARKHYSMCARKKMFSTFSKANQFARKRFLDQRPYLCPYCDTWHLTKLPKNPEALA